MISSTLLDSSPSRSSKAFVYVCVSIMSTSGTIIFFDARAVWYDESFWCIGAFHNRLLLTKPVDDDGAGMIRTVERNFHLCCHKRLTKPKFPGQKSSIPHSMQSTQCGILFTYMLSALDNKETSRENSWGKAKGYRSRIAWKCSLWRVPLHS